MIDKKYRDAFKEVYEILENTDNELLQKIPKKFLIFIKDNMSEDYVTKIVSNKTLDEQELLEETEAILALIYRSYWATEEEKKEFQEKAKKEIEENQIQYKNIEEIFASRNNKMNNMVINKELIVVKEKNIFSRILEKIKKFFKK